jgi:hypothetical protein
MARPRGRHSTVERFLSAAHPALHPSRAIIKTLLLPPLRTTVCTLDLQAPYCLLSAAGAAEPPCSTAPSSKCLPPRCLRSRFISTTESTTEVPAPYSDPASYLPMSPFNSYCAILNRNLGTFCCNARHPTSRPARVALLLPIVVHCVNQASQ